MCNLSEGIEEVTCENEKKRTIFRLVKAGADMKVLFVAMK